MAQKKAFVRYAQNKAVPGSLIVRTKAPKVGTWQEVPYDICCGSGCPQTGPFTFTLFEVPEDFGTGSNIRLIFNCLTVYIIPTLGGTGTQGFAIGQLSSPVTTSPTLSELVDLINITFAGQGIVAELVEGVLQVTVSNTDYISEGCTGSYLSLDIIIYDPA